MFSEVKVTKIYCMAVGFCKEFAKIRKRHMVESKNIKLHIHRSLNSFIANPPSVIAAYFFQSKRPATILQQSDFRATIPFQL